MKLDKGLFLDSSETNQPQGTWKYMLNGTFDRDRNVITDEEGFRNFTKGIPGYECIGTEPIDNDVIVFLSDSNTNHEVGIVYENGFYSKIIGGSLFNFNENFPIKARIVKNFKSERTIVFIDDNNTPKIINIDDIPDILDASDNITTANGLNKIQLFPNFTEAKIINTSIEQGGSLLSGAYYVIIQYENNNNIKTAWSKQSVPFYVTADNRDSGFFGSDSNISSSRRIEFDIDNIDTSFDKINIGLVSEIQGVISVVNYNTENVPSSGTISNYSISSNSGTTLTLEETLVNSTKYLRVGDIELTEEELLGANVTEDEEINFQQWANMIELDYVATYETVDIANNTYNYSVLQDVGNDKGFRSGEVYAFYCSLVLTQGGETRLFHIPGRPSVAGETSVSSYVASENLPAGSKVFQVENTADSISTVSKMGYWENENEVYPSIEDFDSSGLGGLDLQGEKVRHHRFPDQRSLRSGSGTPANFGADEFCRLGVTASNIVIPSHLVDKIEGIKIYYAKRDIENMTCLGQSIYQYAHINDDYGIGAETTNPDNLVLTTGAGNFREVAAGLDMRPVNNTLKFYDFSLLNVKPQISPNYISNQVKLEKVDLFDLTSTGNPEMVLVKGTSSKRVSLDYSDLSGTTGTTGSAVVSGDYIRKVDSLAYVPDNVNFLNHNNLGGDEHVYMKISTSTSGDLTLWTNSASDSANAFTTSGPATFKETTYITDLKQIPLNVYFGIFKDRDVVCCSSQSQGNYLEITTAGTKSTGTLYNGDNFLGVHSVKQHGIEGVDTPIFDADDPTAHYGAGFLGHRLFIHESIQNMNYRYQNNSEGMSEYYPNSVNVGNIFTKMDVFSQINIYYSTDFNQLNDNDALVIYNPEEEVTNKHPYRIIRSNKISRVSTLDLTFPPLSFYEMTKKKRRDSRFKLY